MTEPVIQCRAVSKSYRKTPVLQGLDLDIPKGSVVGLLGKNGSGKTTLLKCALGLVRPDAGQITIFNEPVWNLSANAKARLGYVPQSITLYPWMKVRHIIAYTASFYSRWNHALVADLLVKWELPPDAIIGPLSAGQLQKLAILLSIGYEPDLLILDEPAAALDPIARRDFLATLLEIAADARRTILFSTHITSDLERVADRIVILKQGRVFYAGELDSLKDHVKRLHITGERPLDASQTIAGELHREVHENTARVAVMGVTPELVAQIENQCASQVRIEDLNLDEIFMEVHRV